MSEKDLELFDTLEGEAVNDPEVKEQANQMYLEAPPNGSMAFYKALVPDELLEDERVNELSKIIRSGKADDIEVKEAKDELTVYNIRLVLSRAWYYFKRGVHGSLDLDDMIQFGMEGLMTAVDRFDYTLGFKFSTYATHWIDQAIRRGVANDGNLVRIPVHLHEFLYRYNKYTREFELDNGRKPTDDEMTAIFYDLYKVEEDFAAKHNGKEPDENEKQQLWDSMKHRITEARRTKDTYMSMPSLDLAVGEEKESVLGDFVVPTDDKDVGDTIIDEIFYKEFIKVVKTVLTDREWFVLKKRFGLGQDGKVYTLEECGAEMGVTRERVRQIQDKALRKLKINPAIRKFLPESDWKHLYLFSLRTAYSEVFTPSGNLSDRVSKLKIDRLIKILTQHTSHRRDEFENESVSATAGLTEQYDIPRLRDTVRRTIQTGS